MFCWFFPLFVDCSSYMATELCTFLAFTTFTSVRTEPQATSAAPGKKIKELLRKGPSSSRWTFITLWLYPIRVDITTKQLTEQILMCLYIQTH